MTHTTKHATQDLSIKLLYIKINYMNSQSIYIALVSSMLSGLLGVFISTYHYSKSEKKKIKVDTAKRLFANRYDIVGEEFSRALNEVFIVFHNSEKVMKALSAFHDVTVSGQSALANEKLTTLFKEICKDCDIGFANFNDSFFLMPFNANR